MPRPMRVLTVFGTRPEAIKMAPVVKALVAAEQIDARVCVTAQHREMLDQVLDLFRIVPDYDLNLMKPGQDLTDITANDLAFFNDTAIGIAPSNSELRDYATRLGLRTSGIVSPLTHLESSGYVRMEAGLFTLLADLARIGPDYLPGHAHADTLSFELSWEKHRVFVNSGTSEYGTGPERLRQRGTAAHNTVIVEGQNSSEVWSGFRVGRRARPQAISVGVDERGTQYAEATHDG